jgi:hypothetical protein
MEQERSPKTFGDSIYSIGEDGKLTILAAGQYPVVLEARESLELLQWLYANRDVLLKAAYPEGIPDWAKEGKTSEQDTQSIELPLLWEKKQREKKELDISGK